jgi:hypothetical protein
MENIFFVEAHVFGELPNNLFKFDQFLELIVLHLARGTLVLIALLGHRRAAVAALVHHLFYSRVLVQLSHHSINYFLHRGDFAQWKLYFYLG